MNCLEVRRKLTIDPALGENGGESASETGLVTHLQHCASCAAFSESLAHLDTDLREIINVPLPDNLASRILLKRHVLNRRQHQWRRQLGYSMAAGLLLVLSLFSLDYMTTPQPASLSAQALAHVKNEMEYLARRDNNNLQQVNAILGGQQIQLTKIIAPVNFIENCTINRKKSIHMIIQGQSGPVTLLLMRNRGISSQIDISDERFKGLVIPIFNNSSIAIIGEKQEQLHEIVQRLLPALQPV